MRGRARATAGAAIVAMLAGALVAVAAGPATGAIDNVVDVEKVVVGTAPAGTVFTIHYECDVSPDGNLTYGATGTPLSGGGSFAASIVDTCTISETVSGGASGTNFF